VTRPRYPHGVKTWIAIALTAGSLIGCASETPSRTPPEDPKAFKAPAPLTPQGIDTTPEVVKAPWKKAPVSVSGADRGLATELVQQQTAELDAKTQEDEARANAARRGKVRRGKRRQHAGKVSRSSRIDLDALAKQGAKALETQTRTQHEGSALQIRVARAQALLTTSGVSSSQLLRALEDQVERTGSDARGAERKASAARTKALNARRFLEVTLKQGLVVPAARLDARKAELGAQRLEVTALRLRWLNQCAQHAKQQALKESLEGR
jgi:hypothetical protein